MSDITLSATQLETFGKCEQCWKLRYIDGLIQRPVAAMVKGTGLHKGAEYANKYKAQYEQAPPIDETTDAARDGVVNEIEKSGIQIGKDEKEKQVIDSLKDDAVKLVTGYQEQVLPDYMPKTVEEKLEMDLGNGIKLLGYLDFTADFYNDGSLIESDVIVDIKSGKNTPNPSGIQGQVYGTIKRRDLGFDPLFSIEHVKEFKNGTKRESRGAHIRRGDSNALANRLNAIIPRMKSIIEHAGQGKNICTPAPSLAWWCSENWCAYYNGVIDNNGVEHRCPHVYRGF